MNFRLLMTSFTISLASSLAFGATATSPNAKAAELSCHRIDRLVTLKKIDAKFLNRFRGMEVKTMAGGAGQPSFEVIASEEADQGKSANQVKISLDQDSKPLAFTVVAGDDATNPTVWPDKDPVTLAEDSLHFLEQNVAKPDIAKFNSGLTGLRISPADVGGKSVAKIEIVSSDTKGTLKVYISTAGDFVSYEVVQ
jgi:hypothetical protein